MISDVELACYQKSGISHPGISQNPTPMGTLGYSAITLISSLVAPIIGALSAVVLVVNYVRNRYLLDLAYKESHDYKLKPMGELISQTASRIDLEIALEENKRKLFASVLAIVPLFGIIMAGDYLKLTSKHVKEDGLRGYIEAIMEAFTIGQSKYLQRIYYPLQGKPLDRWLAESKLQKIEDQHNGYFKKINGQSVDIPVSRGHHESVLSGYLIPEKSSNSFDPDSPTMVVFHGNGQTLHALGLHAAFYHDRGFNVLLATMGGYPGSDESEVTSEISCYQDADAVILYLKQLGALDIGIHGISMGGALAFAGAELHPDVVKLVVPDQAFTRARDAAANLTHNLSQGLLPAAVIRGAAGSAFLPQQAVPGVIGIDGKHYLTDGLDNLRKAALLRQRAEDQESVCEVFAVKTDCDMMMGRNGDVEKGFSENFADDLVLARYGEIDGHTIQLHGGHCMWYGYGQNDPDQAVGLSDILEKVFFS